MTRRLGRTNRETPGFQASFPGDGMKCLRLECQEAATVVVECPAGCREPDRTPDSLDDARTDAALELTQLRRDRGLRDMEAPRCRGDAACLGDGSKDTKPRK